MSASAFSVCLLVCVRMSSVSADQWQIKAKFGDDVTLHCRGPKDVSNILLTWRKDDLSEGYVFFYHINRPYEYLQHPSVFGRVQLRDPEMKGRDVSVILKNVTIKDTGTYECRVSVGSSEPELIDTVILKVEDSDDGTSCAQREIKAKSGDDVTLHGRGPRDEAISLLSWRRPDLPDGYVFFFRDGFSYVSYQHPSFRGRVQLRDPEMKDGDVSVTLKNVNINDTGTYECRIIISNTRRSKRTTDIRHRIYLKVEDSGHTAGNTRTEGHKDGGKMDRYTRVVIGLSVGVVLLVIVGLLIFKLKFMRQNSYQHPVEMPDFNQL